MPHRRHTTGKVVMNHSNDADAGPQPAGDTDWHEHVVYRRRAYRGCKGFRGYEDYEGYKGNARAAVVQRVQAVTGSRGARGLKGSRGGLVCTLLGR